MNRLITSGALVNFAAFLSGSPAWTLLGIAMIAVGILTEAVDAASKQ